MDLSKIQLPGQKAWAAGIGGIIGWLISLALNNWLHFDLGDQGTAAVTLLVGMLLTAIVPPSKQDVLKHIDDEIAQAGVILGKLTAASDQNAAPTPAAKALAAKSS